MTKKYLILFVLAILLIGLVGLAIYQTKKNSNLVINNIGNSQLISGEKPLVVSSTTKNQLSNIASSTTDLVSNVNTNTNTQVNSSVTKDLAVFNNKFPEINIKQINSFLAVAVKGDMQDCESMSDLNDQCKYYFALYKNAAGYCGDINDKNIQFDCYTKLVFNNLSSSFNNCTAIKSAFEKVNCLENIFWAINDLKSCSIFDSQSIQIQQACLDSVIFKSSMSQYKNNCASIKDTDIKDYCELRFK